MSRQPVVPLRFIAMLFFALAVSASAVHASSDSDSNSDSDSDSHSGQQPRAELRIRKVATDDAGYTWVKLDARRSSGRGRRILDYQFEVTSEPSARRLESPGAFSQPVAHVRLGPGEYKAHLRVKNSRGAGSTTSKRFKIAGVIRPGQYVEPVHWGPGKQWRPGDEPMLVSVADGPFDYAAIATTFDTERVQLAAAPGASGGCGSTLTNTSHGLKIAGGALSFIPGAGPVLGISGEIVGMSGSAAASACTQAEFDQINAQLQYQEEQIQQIETYMALGANVIYAALAGLTSGQVDADLTAFSTAIDGISPAADDCNAGLGGFMQAAGLWDENQCLQAVEGAEPATEAQDPSVYGDLSANVVSLGESLLNNLSSATSTAVTGTDQCASDCYKNVTAASSQDPNTLINLYSAAWNQLQTDYADVGSDLLVAAYEDYNNSLASYYQQALNALQQSFMMEWLVNQYNFYAAGTVYQCSNLFSLGDPCDPNILTACNDTPEACTTSHCTGPGGSTYLCTNRNLTCSAGTDRGQACDSTDSQACAGDPGLCTVPTESCDPRSSAACGNDQSACSFYGGYGVCLGTDGTGASSNSVLASCFQGGPAIQSLSGIEGTYFPPTTSPANIATLETAADAYNSAQLQLALVYAARANQLYLNTLNWIVNDAPFGPQSWPAPATPSGPPPAPFDAWPQDIDFASEVGASLSPRTPLDQVGLTTKWPAGQPQDFVLYQYSAMQNPYRCIASLERYNREQAAAGNAGTTEDAFADPAACPPIFIQPDGSAIDQGSYDTKTLRAYVTTSGSSGCPSECSASQSAPVSYQCAGLFCGGDSATATATSCTTNADCTAGQACESSSDSCDPSDSGACDSAPGTCLQVYDGGLQLVPDIAADWARVGGNNGSWSQSCDQGVFSGTAYSLSDPPKLCASCKNIADQMIYSCAECQSAQWTNDDGMLVCAPGQDVCRGFVAANNVCGNAAYAAANSAEITKGPSGTGSDGCAADYGAVAGDPVCCGQPGNLVAGDGYACGSELPKCVGFIQGVNYGTCQSDQESFTDCSQCGAEVIGLGNSMTGNVSLCNTSTNADCVADDYPYVCCTGDGTGNCEGSPFAWYRPPVGYSSNAAELRGGLPYLSCADWKPGRAFGDAQCNGTTCTPPSGDQNTPISRNSDYVSDQAFFGKDCGDFYQCPASWPDNDCVGAYTYVDWPCGNFQSHTGTVWITDFTSDTQIYPDPLSNDNCSDQAITFDVIKNAESTSTLEQASFTLTQTNAATGTQTGGPEIRLSLVHQCSENCIDAQHNDLNNKHKCMNLVALEQANLFDDGYECHTVGAAYGGTPGGAALYCTLIDGRQYSLNLTYSGTNNDPYGSVHVGQANGD